MDNFTRVYNDVISKWKCQELINLFESENDLHEVQHNGLGATLTQVNLMESPRKAWQKETEALKKSIRKCVEQYKIDCDIQPLQWPTSYEFEPPKMKRYLPGTTDEFPEHVDVRDLSTARRFLVTFLYLTDNENASTVVCPKDDEFVSKCRRGPMILFPPMWPWRHVGKKPLNNPKYIIGSYLHYGPTFNSSKRPITIVS